MLEVEKKMKRKYENEKSTRMMVKVTRNMKIFRQNCDTLLSRRDEMPEMLHAKINKIDLEPNKPFYFKIEIQYLTSPITFNV